MIKDIHYAVVLETSHYNKIYELPEMETYIVYETLNEILQKFPYFGTVLQPQWHNEKTFLLGNSGYNGIWISRIELTYKDVSTWRPTEDELRRFLLKKQKRKLF